MADKEKNFNFVTHYELDLYKDYTEKRLDKLDKVSDSLKDNTDELKIQMKSIDSNISRLNEQLEDFTDNIGNRIDSKVDILNKNVDTRLTRFDEKLDSFDGHIKKNREDIDTLEKIVDDHDDELKIKKTNLNFWGIIIPAAISGIVMVFTALLQFFK